MQIEINLPEGMQAEYKDTLLTIKGNNKENSRKFSARMIKLEVQDKKVVLTSLDEKKNTLKLLNTLASHVRNLIMGLQKEFEYKLEATYSHFPLTINLKGDKIEINNLAGAKKARFARIIGNAQVQIKGKEITVKGTNKEHVGQTAANLENATRITNKDRRVYQDGIWIVEKDQRKEME